METFTHSVRVGAGSKAKPRAKVLQFGDGYSQRQADGINTDLRTYSVKFTDFATKIEEIDDFFTRHGGVKAFLWQAPDRHEPRLYICPEWDTTFITGNIREPSATFVEVVA